MKKRKGDTGRKPRSERTYARTAGEVTEISLHYDPITDEVQFDTPVVNTYHEVTYKRAKGPKVLTMTPLLGPALQLDSNQALIKNHDILAAVDTNTRIISDLQISVTGIVRGVLVHDSQAGTHVIAFRTPFCLEFVDISGSPEKMGWAMAVHELVARSELHPGASVGLIVDSHLGELPAFNAREVPLTDDFLLPKGIEMIYASSDVGREYGANMLIQQADRASTLVLDYLEEGRAVLKRKVLRGFPFKGYRVIFGREPQAG
jgi:hypothetical protein